MDLIVDHAVDLGPHAGFIELAYGFAALIVTLMIVWIVVDHRRQARTLAELEARGMTRRSERVASLPGESMPRT
jgi:heme exporter protein D